MTHPETAQLREDENEYQRGLDAAEERQVEIDKEVSYIRNDIACKNQHEQFVEDWYADPAGEFAAVIRMACLYNRAQAAQLGEAIQTIVNDKIRQVAEITVDRRLK